MPEVIFKPRTYNHIDSFLSDCLEKIGEVAVGEEKLTTETKDKVLAQSPLYHKGKIKLFGYIGDQAEMVSATLDSFHKTERTATNFYKILKADVEDGLFLVSDFPYYGMNSTHPIIPDLRSEGKAKSFATTIVDGEAERILNGRPANSRVALVGTVLGIFKANILSRKAAEENHSNQAIVMHALNDLALPLWDKVVAELKGAFSEMTDTEIKLRLMQYGVKYMHTGLKSKITIKFLDADTNEPLIGVVSEEDETGAAGTSNDFGDAVIETTTYGNIHINAVRVDYKPLELFPITITEGSVNAYTLKMHKILP